MDWWALALAGFFVGSVVGLTGMGGGALMTPVLVLFFKVEPLTAVSSDLVAAFFMKPVGAFVHLRRGTVNLKLVKWLCVGSVPSAFAGVFVLRLLGDGEQVQDVVKKALGIALLVSATGLIIKAYITMRARARRRAAGLPGDGVAEVMPQVAVRVVPTVLVGMAGGLVVGMTSVGSGSLIIISLLALYPMLHASQLVGTDLLQAVPLVAAASLGHILYGDFQLSLTAALLVGAIPGVWLGAQGSARAPGGVVRRALALVLLASGLKLLGMSTIGLALVLLAVVVVGPLVWMSVRRRHGLPSLARLERAQRAARADVGPAAAGE